MITQIILLIVYIAVCVIDYFAYVSVRRQVRALRKVQELQHEQINTLITCTKAMAEYELKRIKGAGNFENRTT